LRGGAFHVLFIARAHRLHARCVAWERSSTKEREQAEHEYQAAHAAGKTATLLEQDRPTQPPASTAATGASALIVIHDKRLVTYFGQPVSLSKYEYEILIVFITRPGQVFTREQLMNRVWEQPEQSLDRTVDAHIKKVQIENLGPRGLRACFVIPEE
jgi:DNA-binding response OmpR family regulator